MPDAGPQKDGKTTELGGAISNLITEVVSNVTQQLKTDSDAPSNPLVSKPEAKKVPYDKNRRSSSYQDIKWEKKPIIIGIYGISGPIKTQLIRLISIGLPRRDFKIYDSSDVIANLVPGGLDAFEDMSLDGKTMWRKRAIRWIEWTSIKVGTHALVVGNFMSWEEGAEKAFPLMTSADWFVYTHILYLKSNPQKIVSEAEMFARRAKKDDDSEQPNQPSVEHLRKWQDEETSQLRTLCYRHKILFVELCTESVRDERLEAHDYVDFLIDNIDMLDTKWCNFAVQKSFSTIFDNHRTFKPSRTQDIETVLVINAGRILISRDVRKLHVPFEPWEPSDFLPGTYNAEKSCISKINYSYTYEECRQASLDQSYSKHDEPRDVALHPELVAMLERVKEYKHVGVIFVQSGSEICWDNVLYTYKLRDVVEVVCDHAYMGIVVTPFMKSQLVGILQAQKKRVIAIGDSALDMDMLVAADEAIIAVGDDRTRCKEMEHRLALAIQNGELTGAHQMLLTETAQPRLDTGIFPLITFTNDKFEKMVFEHIVPPHQGPTITIAGEKAEARLLMAKLEDSKISGPSLRSVYAEIGAYLAKEYLGDVIYNSPEEYDFNNVPGTLTDRQRSRHEERTAIVALMRGGEPMAFGINDVFPSASFMHATNAEDLERHHLPTETVILVDFESNNGMQIVKLVERVLKIRNPIQIVVVTGAIHRECIEKGSLVYELAARAKQLTIITLSIIEGDGTSPSPTAIEKRLFNA